MSALARLGIAENEDFGPSPSVSQAQTRNTFAFKWAQRASYESPMFKANAKRWLFDRYCAGDSTRLKQWLGGGSKIILDAGCGSGFSALLFFGDHLHEHDYLGIDISPSTEVARTRFREAGVPGDFLQHDLRDLPIPPSSVDLIFSEGVLHHTDNTEAALKNLTTKLKPGGRVLFYVYARKAVIREFTDDHIREQLRTLDDETAWAALMPLTKLGKVLGDNDIEIEVPEAIPFLGIPSGKVSLQRLFYWNICKLYYKPEYTLDEMNHINFDWFRPLNCHRHTPQEVQRWCDDLELAVERLHVEEAGITVVARKIENR